MKTEKHKKYVVSFLFTPDMGSVWLIEKQKPEWQRGCLNGIGGKIEDNESPQQAAFREIVEEAGVEVSHLTYVGIMAGTNNDGTSFEVSIFTATTDARLTTQEQEQIGLYEILEIKDHKHIENVPMLIYACIYRLTGSSSFDHMIMNYTKL